MSEKEKEENINELINNHWDYVNNILITHNLNTITINMIKFHYKTAFLHGYKHGITERNNR